MSKYAETNLYVAVNGKLHDLITRCEQLEAKLRRQEEQDNG